MIIINLLMMIGSIFQKILLSHENQWSFLQSLLAYPVQEGYTHGRVCQGRTPSFEDKKESRRRARTYFNNGNGLINVTLALCRYETPQNHSRAN